MSKDKKKHGISGKPFVEDETGKEVVDVSSLGDDVKDALLGKGKTLEVDSRDASVHEESELEEKQEERKSGSHPSGSFQVPPDIAAVVATIWNNALKEMQRRGLLSEDCDLPDFFRAEALSDGSLILRAISMPKGIIMVGKGSSGSWGDSFTKHLLQDVATSVQDRQQQGPVPADPSINPSLRTLKISEGGEVKIA